MHRDFAEWYRSAGIEPDGEMLTKRWTAIDAFEPTADQVVALVKLFFKLTAPTEAPIDGFIEALQVADPAFKIKDNQHEISVLAGAELIDVIDRGSNALAIFSGLAILSAAAQNLRTDVPVREIPEIAARLMAERSICRFSPDHVDTGFGVNKSLYDALVALGAPHSDLAKQLTELELRLAEALEESNMLWWIFSEYSRDNSQPWGTFPVPAVAIMSGKELADLSGLAPGPPSALAMLHRVLKSTKRSLPKTISVKDAFNKTSSEWKRAYTSGHRFAELETIAPITYGLKVSLVANEDSTWAPTFSGTTGISATAQIEPCHLAYQMFLEAMLCRAWKDAK